jgi:hypothetical protein
MAFSSTGKAAHRPALSVPLLGGLPDEDVDIEQAALCEHGNKREHDDGHNPNFYYGMLVLFLPALQLLELGLTYRYAKQVLPFMPFMAVSGTVLFCVASIVYKLSIINNDAAPVPKGWMNVLFITVFLVHLIVSALLLLHLGLTGWLDSAEPIPTFMYAASLFCAASVLNKLLLKKNLVTLVPEVWINAVFATQLLANVEIAFQVLQLGTIFMCLAAGIISSTVSRR